MQGEPFDKPTLFIRAAVPTMRRTAISLLIWRLFPLAQVVTIEDPAGHWVHADKPAELLAVMREFLG